jgi:hypothetical protein
MNSSTTRAFHGFDARRALVRETTRAAIGKQARDLYIQQQYYYRGLNFGYFYVSTLSGTKPSDLKKESNLSFSSSEYSGGSGSIRLTRSPHVLQEQQ